MSRDIKFNRDISEEMIGGQIVLSLEEPHRILYADRKAAHLSGCEGVEEFIDYVGNSFRNMIHPEDLTEAAQSMKAQALKDGHGQGCLRFRIITKQGIVRCVKAFLHYAFYEEGQPCCFVFIYDSTMEEYHTLPDGDSGQAVMEARRKTVDPLTGLRSIIGFQEDSESRFSNAVESIATVAVFDIIGLQDINRKLGRLEGDQRICSLMQTVKEYMPGDCCLYRGYDAEIIALCLGKTEKEVIHDIRETAKACQDWVFFGVASGEVGAFMQVLEEAQYDLNVKKMLNSKSVRSHALTSLVRALEEVDQETEEHVERTRNMGIALGKRLGLSDLEMTTLELMCLLHDIGKIAIPLEILNKPGKLTDAEWEVLRSHADKGYQIAMASKELKPIADCIRYHHERWDGRGYPDKLSGEAIPVLSRIISIVDAYDAMVNDRCYRKALTPAYAMEEIRSNAGTQFDPYMAKVFLELLSENPELAHGQKTGGSDVWVFERKKPQTLSQRSTKPVIYSEYKLDVNDTVIEVGSSFETITGYSPEDAIGKMTQADLIPPEDLEEYQAHVGNQFAVGNTAYLQHHIQRKDGIVINVICHGERYFDSATRSFMATVQIYEVDGDEEEYRNRLLEAQKINALNKTMAAFLDSMPGLTFTKDAATGIYLACNRAFAEYANKPSPDDVIGLTDAQLFDAETAAHFVEDDRVALSMDKPYIFYEEVLDGAGRQKQFQTTKMRYTDVTGKLCLQGMCQDVTDIVRIKHEQATTKQAYEQARDNSTVFGNIAKALARGYTDLYYVNIDTDEFIEFHTDDALGVLTEARKSTDFFVGCKRDARLFVHPKDREAFISAMNRQFLKKTLDQSRVFELIYRRIKNGRTFYVKMTVSRVEGDSRFFVLAVTDIDELIKKRQAEERMNEERLVYARLHALTGNFLVVYVVDLETETYREFSSTNYYSKNLKQAKEGTDFFKKVREEALLYNFPADRDSFLTVFTRENVLKEIKRSGIFSFNYRILMEGKPLYVQLKAAVVEEKEGPRLIVGLNNVDAQVRQEEAIKNRLAMAQSQANIDALTGVKNKHAYLEAELLLDRQIETHCEAPFAIVMLDVNDLKKTNDTAGHKAGDRLLREACKIICDAFKHSPVFRVGGDEFTVIVQGEDYLHIEERVGIVRDHNMKALTTGGVVVACGMARFDKDPCVAAVFERADNLMYANKSSLKALKNGMCTGEH